MTSLKDIGPKGWTGSGKTRKVDPGHREWKPHGYQERAVEWCKNRPVSMLWLDPGLGKTSIVLKAFSDLLEAGEVRKMLVVAPLRVVQLVWRQEAQRWTQFRHLRFSTVHGPAKKRREALAADADVYLVNPEGVKWLCDQFQGRGWPFDVVTIDELTKFKNARSARTKALRPWAARSMFRWGLTGTPAPNGYMDLFGQALVLDDGRAFGRYITHFRDRYFQAGYTGFDWTLKPGADKQIEKRLESYVLRMSAEDYLDMPELVNDVRLVEISAQAKQQYKELKRESVLQFADEDDGRVLAANSGALYSKLKQLANGAVYVEQADGSRKYVHIHDDKLDALEELIEEVGGQQLLVGYEFRHDLERLLQRLGSDTPYLGAGVSDKRAQEIERLWNAGEIPVLLAHPASAGHGLNFQMGGAHHLCWFSTTIDYELYDQFLRRLLRQGNKSARIVNHALVVPGTEDELSLDILDGKAVTQSRLLQALNAEGDEDMVRKVRRKSEVEATEERPRKKGKGWGGKASDEEDDEDEEDGEEEEAPRRRRSRRTSDQPERVRGRLSGDEDDEDQEDEDDEEDAEADEDEKPGFSKRMKARLKGGDAEADEEADEDDEDDEDDEPEPPKKTRKKPVRKAKPASTEDSSDEPPFESGEKVASGGQNAVPGPLAGSAHLDPAFMRERAMHLTAQYAAQLGIRTASDAVKAAKVFEEYLRGDK